MRRKNLAMAWIDKNSLTIWFPKAGYCTVMKYIKYPKKVIQCIEKTMETWTVELTAGEKSFAEVNIQRGIFQGDDQPQLLFVIAMMPLNYILRKCTAVLKISKSQEKINHLIYINDIKLFAKNERDLEILIQTMRIYNQDIGIKFGLEKCWTLKHYDLLYERVGFFFRR